MEKYYAILWIAGFGIACIVLYGLCMAIYSMFNHTHWNSGAMPCQDAEITGIDTDKVQYEKNDAKFRTTVYFSDGFRFVTYKTNREQNFVSYNISVDKDEIARLATIAHGKALAKLRKKGVHIYTKEELVEKEKESAALRVESRPLPPGGWLCTCGRTHQPYESSCVCGVKKQDIK